MAVKLAMIFFSMILVNNYVLVQFLGRIKGKHDV